MFVQLPRLGGQVCTSARRGARRRVRGRTCARALPVPRPRPLTSQPLRHAQRCSRTSRAALLLRRKATAAAREAAQDLGRATPPAARSPNGYSRLARNCCIGLCRVARIAQPRRFAARRAQRLLALRARRAAAAPATRGAGRFRPPPRRRADAVCCRSWRRVELIKDRVFDL
jgi:hypothetical protein